MQQGHVAVAMLVTLEVNPEAWELAFGEYTDEDVLSWLKNYIQGSGLVAEECFDASSVNVRFCRK